MTALELSGDHTLSVATGGREVCADGPLLVLIHGAGMDRTVWSLQTRWLAHHCCATIAIDLPGHGASDEGERSSIGEYADWLASVVGGLGRPVHLGGHSMGSFVALECAARCDIASVTLVGTAAAMPVHPVLLDAAQSDIGLAAGLMSGWAFTPSTRTGPHPSPGSSMVGATSALIAQADPGVLFADLAMCAAYEDAVATVSTLDLPVTYLLGELDRMTPVRAARPMIEATAHPRVEIVPGVGHMLAVEAPSITRTVLAETVQAVAHDNG